MPSSPLKWHGGKGAHNGKLARLIVRALNYQKHTRYVEAYAGGLSPLLYKDPEGVSEFANDINGELVNFWKVLADPLLSEAFIKQASLIPFGEPFYKFAGEAQKRFFAMGQGGGKRLVLLREASVFAAVAFFVRNRQSRQGLGEDFATTTSRIRGGMNENVRAWLSAVEGLPEVCERLRRVEVSCKHAVTRILELDSPKTVFYLDPPYLYETRNSVGEYGENEMSPEEHEELLRCISSIAGKFVLSGYPSALYERYKLVNGWSVATFNTPNHSAALGKREKKELRPETLWANFSFDGVF